jgi:Rrf2 family protein
MQLTLRGDYAVRVMVDLAGRPADTSVRTTDLSRRTGVPRAYLRKVIQDLARAGLVRTRRGMSGGVSLATPPATVTLRRVIEAVEGPIYLNRCARPNSKHINSSTQPITTRTSLLLIPISASSPTSTR